MIENARLYQALERANVQLNEANRLKSEFLGVISHELRSPFSSIGFAIQNFTREGMDNLSADQKRLWNDLIKGVEQAQKQANTLVNYAGLFSRQGQLEFKQINLTELIRQTSQPLTRMAESRQIAVRIEAPENLILPAGDSERLSEAIWHLLQNAVQYNKIGGTVVIRAARNNEHIKIEVQDTGIGIPKEHQERIWESFQQMSDSLKRGVEGLGLGLSIVRYVAVAHGGTVTLESTPNAGSTFAIILPLSPSQMGEDSLVL